MPAPAVEFRAVSKRFGAHQALADFSLAIAPGEFVALLGPSGSGKTTALRLLAGFETPDAGEIHLAGRPVHGLRPADRGLGMVFQHYALFPHRTVAGNVAFGLEQRRVPRDECARRVDEALALVQLDPAVYGGRKPAQLSGGQRQRVALARALVIEPPVLLLDEPLGALDLKLRREMQHELSRLQRRLGTTFVHVTHDQEEAMALSDRLVVMAQGRLLQAGTPRECYERPRTPFVATFLGEANLLAGRGAAGAGGIAVRPERVRVLREESDAAGMVTRDGVIARRTFLGDRLRLEIDAGAERLVSVRAALDADHLAEGDRVRAAWCPDDEVPLAPDPPGLTPAAAPPA